MVPRNFKRRTIKQSRQNGHGWLCSAQPWVQGRFIHLPSEVIRDGIHSGALNAGRRLSRKARNPS